MPMKMMNDQLNIPQEPAHDILRSERLPLDFIFHPRTVAVIGATDRQGSVGRTVIENLQSAESRHKLFPVNPRRTEVLGLPCYPAIGSIPGCLDLAVLVTPAATIPGLIRECVAAGVKGAVIISAGFREIGPEGARLEDEILQEARRGSLRIIGPNCLGIMTPPIGLNATFAQNIALPGNVAFLSQSGALCTAILDWSLSEAVGFSAFVSTGSMLDVGWGDLIYYFGDDPHTRSILIYMESIGDPRSFLSAAREVARAKPIIVIKAGRTEAAAKAAASHTGALTGSDEVLDAAFRRCGVLRVNRIAELFEMADVLSKQPRPPRPSLGHCDQRRRARRPRHGRLAGQRRRACQALPGNSKRTRRLSPSALEPRRSGGYSGRRGRGAISKGSRGCFEGPRKRRLSFWLWPLKQ